MSPSHDPTYPLYPTFAFLGFVFTLIPLPWHLQAWNTGTCAFMIWTALLCLNGFVNALVWSGNVENIAPIWCDISTKYMIGAGVGVPASILCITRRLYNITAIQSVSVSRTDKRRSAMIDLLTALGFPILIMILHVVVQAHRFDILEDIGCYPVIYNTLPAYFLYWMWPAILGLVSLVYSCLTLRSFWRRRLQFQQLIASNSSMSASRYLRLMALACIDVMCTTPLSAYTMYIGNVGVTLSPWISWADTHFDFDHVGQVPRVLWQSDHAYLVSVELTRWLPIICAFVFFGLFGFASEAQRHYSLVFWCVADRFGFKKPSASARGPYPHAWKKAPIPNSPSSPRATLPVYSPNIPSSKKVHGILSLSSSLATDSLELNKTNYDIEDSAGFSSPTDFPPPEYYNSHYPSQDLSPTDPGLSTPPSPRSSRFSLDSQPDTQTLHNEDSQAHIYVSESYHESPMPFPRSPSPAPFADIVATPSRNHFPPLSGPRSLEAIRVTVYTHSESIDAL